MCPSFGIEGKKKKEEDIVRRPIGTIACEQERGCVSKPNRQGWTDFMHILLQMGEGKTQDEVTLPFRNNGRPDEPMGLPSHVMFAGIIALNTASDRHTSTNVTRRHDLSWTEQLD